MTSILFLVSSFTISVVLVPVIISFSKRFELYDVINERKLHSGNISRLGGVAIFAGFCCSLGLFLIPISISNHVHFTRGFFIAAMILAFLTGFIDDLYSLRARYKLILQIITGILVILSGLTINTLNFGSHVCNLGYFSYPVTIFWITLFINAINLTDGVDGLASGIAIIGLIFILTISLMTGNMLLSCLTAAGIGSILGFWTYNYPPAKIFMGDGGAYFIGFLFATLPLMSTFRASTTSSVLVPLILLFLPLWDILQVSLIRLREGNHIFTPDNNHLHHRLIRLGLSRTSTIHTIYIISVIYGLISILLVTLPHTDRFLVYLLLVLFTLLFVFILMTFENIRYRYQSGMDFQKRRGFISSCPEVKTNSLLDITPLHSKAYTFKGFCFSYNPIAITFYSPIPLRPEEQVIIVYHMGTNPIMMGASCVTRYPVAGTKGYKIQAHIVEIEESNRDVLLDNYYNMIHMDGHHDFIPHVVYHKTD